MEKVNYLQHSSENVFHSHLKFVFKIVKLLCIKLCNYLWPYSTVGGGKEVRNGSIKLLKGYKIDRLQVNGAWPIFVPEFG